MLLLVWKVGRGDARHKTQTPCGKAPRFGKIGSGHPSMEGDVDVALEEERRGEDFVMIFTEWRT